MAKVRTVPKSFVGGELSPRMFGRIDDPKYQSGAALLQNFYVEANGSARMRPGTKFVRATRNSTKKARLVPFRAGSGDTIRVELGFRQEYPGSSSIPGYARFHSDGATQLHSRPYDAGTNYVAGDHVTDGGTLFRSLGSSLGVPTSNPAWWKTLAYVPERIVLTAAPSPPNSGVTTGSPGSIFFGTGVNHGLVTDDTVEFTADSGSSLPLGITAGVTYYAIIVDAETIRLATTPGGSGITISSVGTGTQFRMHRVYAQGDLVSSGGTVYYCSTTRPITTVATPTSIAPPTESHWYAMPATGEYEIPTTTNITETALFLATTHSHQSNVMSFAFADTLPAELTRVSAATWTWNAISFAPPIDAPTGVAQGTVVRGSTVGVTAFAAADQVDTSTPHNLVPGIDHVWLETTLPSVSAAYYRVTEIMSATRFRCRIPQTGGSPTFSVGAATGTIQVATLHADTSSSYIVTAINEDGAESKTSAPVTINNNLFATGAYNTITWNAVDGASRYNVYKLLTDSGLYGYIGSSAAASFRDDGIAATLDKASPIFDTSLDGQAPRAVVHHEGRRGFAATATATQDVWLMRSNTESDNSYSLPVKDTDRIHRRVKARQACTILHLVSLGNLIALTDTTEFQIGPVNTDALTPDSFAARAQSYVGCANTQPEVMHNAVVFAARGGRLYQMGFSSDDGGYITRDLCERCSHLFDGYVFQQLAAQRSPNSIAWAARSDGVMLGMTFVPSQQVNAAHRHTTTGGVIESVCAGLEGTEDVLYMIVRRTVNGSTVRYVEQMQPMTQPAAWADQWYVDCGLRYEGSAVSTVTGLSHLEGLTVAVFADGLKQTSKVVTSGQITLDTAASKVLVGIAPDAILQTVPAAFGLDGYGSGMTKNVGTVWVRVEKSGPFTVGVDLNDMYEPEELTVLDESTGLYRVSIPGEWSKDAQIYIRQTSPLPVNVVSVTTSLEAASG